MNPKDHPLFKLHPSSTALISVGEVPTPYQIYAGYGTFIGGFAELKVVRQFLKDESVVPVQNDEGKALMGLWVCDFTDASLDPHHELQISFLTSRTEIQPLPSYPLSVLIAMLTHPEIEMLCHGLWNNTSKVVAFNRELLSLNARLSTGKIQKSCTSMTFVFHNAST